MKKIFITFILCFSLCNVIVYAQLQTDTLNIFFDIDKSVVDDDNAKPLNKLISDPNVISISIYGYTDFLGSATYNQQLSEKRSKNVRHYLILKGINEKNIILSKGKGVHPNSVKENRQNLSDKGIQDHRTVKIVYGTKSQYITAKEALSEKNLVVGNNIVLGNVLFYGASDELRPESYPVLEELFETMQKYSTLKIEIQGHICCYTGYDDDVFDGKPLSVSRAEVVRNYLIEKGIESERMTYHGYAASRKRYPERNRYEADLNKRVEILILEK